MQQNKLFSIILPTRNNLRTIWKCLESIKNQTYANIEVIFIDNFSTDWTYEIAKEYENILNIKVFQVWPERNIQRHFWFEKSTWEYLYFLDSDMYLEPTLVWDAIIEFENNDNIWWIIVPEDNIPWELYWTKVKAFERSFYDWDDTIEAARIFKRKVYEEVWWYDQSLISWEDWDLSERIKSKHKISRIKWRVAHDEWEIVLSELLKKKLYYWWKISWYVKKQSYLWMLKKIYFFRPIFYKKFHKFINHPFLSLWFIYMMNLELIMFGIWYIKDMKKNVK